VSVLFGDAYWTQVWAQSLHLQVMPSDEGGAVAVNWMRLLEHLGQDFVSVALTGSRLVSSVIGDPLFSFLQRASAALRAISRRRVAKQLPPRMVEGEDDLPRCPHSNSECVTLRKGDCYSLRPFLTAYTAACARLCILSFWYTERR
jgi:hypothetical protein